MGLRINTNLQAINAQKNLRFNQADISNNMERLASGKRINRSMDDAAGMAISSNLNGKIKSFQQAGRNALDGSSFIQVAEGGIAKIADMTVRVRELAIQAASDTVGTDERTYLDAEVQQLKSEMQRVSMSTEFNNTKLLNGSGGKMEFQIGVGSDEFLDRISYSPDQTNVTLDSLGMSGVDITSKEGARTALDNVDKAIVQINKNRATLGAVQSRLTATSDNIEISNENLSAAVSRIQDADYSRETAELAKNTVKTNAATSVLAQANTSNQYALKLLG